MTVFKNHGDTWSCSQPNREVNAVIILGPDTILHNCKPPRGAEFPTGFGINIPDSLERYLNAHDLYTDTRINPGAISLKSGVFISGKWNEPLTNQLAWVQLAKTSFSGSCSSNPPSSPLAYT